MYTLQQIAKIIIILLIFQEPCILVQTANELFDRAIVEFQAVEIPVSGIVSNSYSLEYNNALSDASPDKNFAINI